MTFTSYPPVRSSYAPGVNIFEKDGEVLLEVELPGRKREEVSVEVVDRILKISTKDAVVEREGYEASYLERRRVGVERSFRLGADLDSDKIQARFENGLLLLSIPKHASAQPRKVEII